jgi:hypothetical protein
MALSLPGLKTKKTSFFVAVFWRHPLCEKGLPHKERKQPQKVKAQ